MINSSISSSTIIISLITNVVLRGKCHTRTSVSEITASWFWLFFRDAPFFKFHFIKFSVNAKLNHACLSVQVFNIFCQVFPYTTNKKHEFSRLFERMFTDPWLTQTTLLFHHTIVKTLYDEIWLANSFIVLNDQILSAVFLIIAHVKERSCLSQSAHQ